MPRQVIATASEQAQAHEMHLAIALISALLFQSRRVLVFSPLHASEYWHALDARLAPDFSASDSQAIQIVNPRHLEPMKPAELIQAFRPDLLVIESPDIVMPCTEGWEYVLQKHSHHDPWGPMARYIKSLAQFCPIWVWGELCYSLKFLEHLQNDLFPESESHWRSCAQLEAYLSYWDCVLEVKDQPNAAGELNLKCLKNRLGSSFGQETLTLDGDSAQTGI